jgi:hypothetical protein
MFEKRYFQEKSGQDDDIGCFLDILFRGNFLLTRGVSGI